MHCRTIPYYYWELDLPWLPLSLKALHGEDLHLLRREAGREAFAAFVRIAVLTVLPLESLFLQMAVGLKTLLFEYL